MNSLHASSDFPVDAVITWVDGADPKHKAKLDAYLASIGGARPRAASPSRFHNSDEIDYCVTSLLRFAPWIRKIFIVTDDQQPRLMAMLKNTEYEQRVVIVDHKTIFAGYEQALPTFNIRSILAVLWRIPELSENFIFLNDDFSLLRPVSKQDFFRDNKVVVRGKWVTYSDQRLVTRWLKKLRDYFKKTAPPNSLRVKHLAAQEYSAKLAGLTKRYYQIGHNPHPWRKSTTESFFAANPQLFEDNLKHRFRSAEQFISESLAASLEVQQKNAILDNSLATLQLKPAEQSLARLLKKIQTAESQQQYAFVCVQNFEQASVEAQQAIVEWLNQRVGSIAQLVNKKSG